MTTNRAPDSAGAKRNFFNPMNLLFVITLLSAILCADPPPKPTPQGKEELILVHPPSLKTEYGKTIDFKEIFLTPGIHGVFFGGIPDGYVHSIGLLSLLALTELPIESIYRFQGRPRVNPILNQRALNQSKVDQSDNPILKPDSPLSSAWKAHFTNPKDVTIRQCLQKRSFFNMLLVEYNSIMEPYLSRPFSKILAIAKLNSTNIKDLCNQDDESVFDVNNLIWLLNDPRFLPFLLRLEYVPSTELNLEVYAKLFPSKYDLSIEAHPSDITFDFALNSSLVSLYHLHPAAFTKLTTTYEVSSIPDLISKFRTVWITPPAEKLDLFLREFDDQARLVILPFRCLGTEHSLLSTGNTSHLYKNNSDAIVHMKIADGNLVVDMENVPSYSIFRIHSDGHLESIDHSVPYQELAIPGAIYAIRLEKSEQEPFLLLLRKISIELMADVLTEHGFCVFAILPSCRSY